MQIRIPSIESKDILCAWLSNNLCGFYNVQQVFEWEIFALVSPIQTLNEKGTACARSSTTDQIKLNNLSFCPLNTLAWAHNYSSSHVQNARGIEKKMIDKKEKNMWKR